MLKLIKVDIQNCINNIRFKIAFFILFFIPIINYIFVLLNSINKPSNLIAIDRYQGILLGSNGGGRSVWGFFLLIMLILVVSMFSDSFYLEQKNGVYISIHQRIGKTQYILSKLIVCGIVSFISVFFVLFVNELLSYITFNGVGSHLVGHYSYDSSGMDTVPLLGAFGDKYIFLGKFILIMINAIYAAVISMVTFAIFLVVNIKNYVAIIGIFILDYMIDLMIPSLYYGKLSMLLIRQGGGENILYFFIIIGLWSLVTTIFIIIGLKKDSF